MVPLSQQNLIFKNCIEIKTCLCEHKKLIRKGIYLGWMGGEETWTIELSTIYDFKSVGLWGYVYMYIYLLFVHFSILKT